MSNYRSINRYATNNTILPSVGGDTVAARMLSLRTSAPHQFVPRSTFSEPLPSIDSNLKMQRFQSFLLFFITWEFNSAVQINYIKVPSAVKNDSGSPVILDCNYSVRPDDSELVVKWLLNDEVVYQWIPPQKPQSLGRLKNRVDLNYKATDDPKSVYRAMKIWNPTTDIAGEYRCFVSTFADEDFSVKNMIVFEPERSLVILKQEFNYQSVNFTCSANEVYPAPKLILYKDRTDDFYNKNPLQTLEWNTSRHPNGRFSVFVVAHAMVDSLVPGSLIHCELRIPGTGYVKKRSLLYYPTAQTGCGRALDSCSAQLVLILSLLISAFSI
nr:PREDICTED: uncharacterized protein LOC660111 isoform X2 [Tribolium castaneum]|eukprot:XP_015836856.1 PREDICTED: uncharacterized protein LOC660111 isoform X2 [Tribolium castaneum]